MSTRYEKYKEKSKAYAKLYYEKNKAKINKNKRKPEHERKLTQLTELPEFQIEFFTRKKRNKGK